MQILITTLGRADDQRTYRNLPDVLKKKTRLVVQYKERDLYPDYKTIVLPKNITMLSPTRQYIIEKIADKKTIILDDDIGFDTRRTDDPTKFVNSTPKDIIKLFETIHDELSEFAHVGVLAREGGNRITKETVQCTRQVRVLAYRTDILKKEKVKFDRLPCQSDFDVTLQLLRKGYPNLILCKWVQGQGNSNAPGGCSTYRTLEMLRNNSKNLARLHSPFVKLVEKETKTAWGGGKRLDVHVQWKKAYESSQK